MDLDVLREYNTPKSTSGFLDIKIKACRLGFYSLLCPKFTLWPQQVTNILTYNVLDLY